MKNIGGNINLVLQTKTITPNDLGEDVISWSDCDTLYGFLDLSGNNTNYSKYMKVDESTHVFISDYKDVSALPLDMRAVCNGKIFDVLYIDDPMELHEQLEIYLKRV